MHSQVFMPITRHLVLMPHLAAVYMVLGAD